MKPPENEKEDKKTNENPGGFQSDESFPLNYEKYDFFFLNSKYFFSSFVSLLYLFYSLITMLLCKYVMKPINLKMKKNTRS